MLEQVSSQNISSLQERWEKEGKSGEMFNPFLLNHVLFVCNKGHNSSLVTHFSSLTPSPNITMLSVDTPDQINHVTKTQDKSANNKQRPLPTNTTTLT